MNKKTNTCEDVALLQKAGNRQTSEDSDALPILRIAIDFFDSQQEREDDPERENDIQMAAIFLRSAREQKKLTVSGLSKASKVSTITIHAIEEGVLPVSKVEKRDIKRLLDCLGISRQTIECLAGGCGEHFQKETTEINSFPRPVRRARHKEVPSIPLPMSA